ncbi:MAG: diguanylate cyclase [Rhizobacter sp.]|nr:diguanylate cyclase [Rhizobacter sp.]
MFRTFNVRWLWTAYLAVTALAVGAFAMAWSARQDQLWQGMVDAGRDAAREVSLSTRSARDAVYMLQGVANGLFQQPAIQMSEARRAQLVERLDYPGTFVLLPDGHAVHREKRTTSNIYRDWPALSLVGSKPAAGSELAREIEVALSLSPALIRAKSTQTAAVAVYYLSGLGFHLIYPPAQDDLQLFTPDMLRHGAYRHGLVEGNPRRLPVWSGAYDDPKGNGLISTLAIPIDDAEGNYRGVAAMDFQLDSLSQYLRRSGLGIGTAFIMDDNDRVIAHPTLVRVSSDHAPSLDDVAKTRGVPAGGWSALHNAPANNPLRLGGEVAMVFDIEAAPWRYVLMVDRAELRWAALRSMVMEGIGLGVLLMLLAYAESRRRDAVVSLRRKAAEEVLQAAPAPVAVMRQSDMSIVVANAALMHLFEAPSPAGPAAAAESAHRQLRELIHTLTEQTLSDVDTMADRPLLRADGSPLWLLVRCVPVVHEEQPAWLCSLTDVSALKQTRDQLEALATTDPLTGAMNRRAVSEAAQSELQRARRSGKPFAALLMDIDHFKRVNDTHGHQAGDRALVQVAAACQAQLREIDRFGRWGGEEFVVLLPETDLEGALAAAERMRQAVQALVVTSDSGVPIPVTLSVGVAMSGARDDEHLEALLMRADTALYRAKHDGRNCVRTVAGLEAPQRGGVAPEPGPLVR